MEQRFRWRRGMYALIAGALLFSLGLLLMHSQSIVRLSRNFGPVEEDRVWRPSVAAAPASNLPPFCILTDDRDAVSGKLAFQAERVLAYMKRASVLVRPVDDGLPESCGSVIVATARLDVWKDWKSLIDRVEKGGTLLFAIRPEGSAATALMPLLGVERAEGAAVERGIRLVRNLLVGAAGMSLDDPFMANTVSRVSLAADAEVWATTASGTPLVWKRPHGDGAFVVFNGTVLHEKINRGLLAGMIGLSEPDFVYPVFGVRLMYIDDFPAPFPRGTDERIFRDYQRELPRFYREVWWPDMRKLASRQNWRYTAVFIESYNDRVEPPFASPPDANVRDLIVYGREVIGSGGEIGLHGYNHQSLQTDPDVARAFGYRPWPDVERMESAVREALRFFAEGFPNYTPTVYVPTSNVLDEAGRRALRQAWPSLSVVASLYPEDPQGFSFVQEFRTAEDGILDMPRFTAGYAVGAFEKWVAVNAVTMHGMFSHFIHPDDILDETRGKGMEWEKLYGDFAEFTGFITNRYPWLKSVTASEAARVVDRTLATGVTWTRDGARRTGRLEPFSGPVTFLLRSDRTVVPVSGCRIRQVDEGVYEIEATAAVFSFRLEG